MPTNRSRRGNGRAQGDEGDDTPEDEDLGINVIEAENPEINLQPEPNEEEGEDPLVILQANFDQMQRERDALLEQRQSLQARNEETEAVAINTQRGILTAAHQTATSELKAAKTAYANAMREQDFDAAADAQEKIATHTLEVQQYGNALSDFDVAVKQPRQREQPARPANRDAQIDQFITTLPADAQAWAKKNRADLFKTDARTQEAMALHNVATSRNLKAGSDEYWQFMNDQMGYGDVAKNEPKAKPKRPVVAAAPVSRGTGGRAVDVTLTRDEIAAAKRMNMSPQRYAAHKKRAQDGAKDPDYRGPLYSKDERR